ncbi:MAG: VWA domain-containing protein [Eubacteriales bacterium]|nr:VWA domain-containing protein [Eubacteriales bacterium]
MKGKSNRFVRTILTAILSLAMVFTTIPLTAFTALADDAAPAATTEGVPTTTKTVTPNGDGTYKIKIGVKGAQVTSQNITKANVVVVMDTSGSMDNTTDNGQTRMDAAKAAVDSVADTLLAYNSKISGVTDVVQMALISFSDTASINVQPTTKANIFKSTVNSLNATGGTNWEAALQQVKNVSFGNNEPTYVIFVSDGNPTFRNTRGDTAKLPRTDNKAWTNNNTYNIYCNDDVYYNGYGYWYGYTYYTVAEALGVYGLGGDSQITTDSYGRQQYAPNYSPTSMQRCYDNALDDAQNLVSSKGYKLYAIGAYGNVNRMRNLVTDTGEDASQYYFNASNTTELNNALSKIAQAISSTLGDSNVKVDDGVTDLAAITAKTSEPTSGFTYTQTDSNGTESAWADAPAASYANGIVTWDLSSVGALDPNTTYSVSFDVWLGQGAYDLVADLNNGVKTYDRLTDAEKDQITATPNSDGTTSYTLKTNSSLVTSYTYNENNLTDTPSYENGEMEVKSAKLSLTKQWVNNLKDGQTETPVTLTVKQDGNDYISKDLSADNGWTSEVYVAPGLIKGSDVLVAGHDYTVTEKTTGSDTSDYHWELSAATYHPMIIDGQLQMLQQADDGTYAINGKNYKVADDQTTLTATNTRRSNLNLTKKVEGTDPNADKALFTYNVTVTDPTGSDIWFSVMDADGKLVSGSDLTTTVAEAQTDGYYKVTSGAAFTVAMKAGWNLRVLNLPTGSTYSMEEKAMPDGYHFVSADSTTTTKNVSGQTVTGTIDAPDNSYTVTYTNQYDGFFYVYHTSNNTIEAVSMTPYVTDTTAKYNLWAQTAQGTIYGGYYNNYYSKGTVVTNGSECSVSGAAKPYNGEITAFAPSVATAYTENAGAIRPVEGTVYYLKEVPSKYLDSKIYVSYHNYAVKDADGNVTGYNRPISNVFAVAAVDDKNYSDVGFIITSSAIDYPKVESVTVSKMPFIFKVTQGDKTETYTIKKLFSPLTKGYLANTAISTDAASYTVTPYWITPDGIVVQSTSVRYVTLGDTADSSTVDGTPVVTATK